MLPLVLLQYTPPASHRRCAGETLPGSGSTHRNRFSPPATHRLGPFPPFEIPLLKSSSIKPLPVPRVEAGPSTPAIQSGKDVWLQEWRREARIPEERIEHLLEEDRAVAIELIGNVRSFVQAYRSSWEREEKEPLPQWDGPKAAAMLVATPAPDEADAWNVLRALQQLAERGLLEPWCLEPALSSARVHELVAGRMGEGRQWMQSIWDAMLARFDRRGPAGDAPTGFEPTFEALAALAALCKRDPTEASLHDLLARRAARSSSHIAALLDTGILHPNERTRQGHTVLGEMLLRPHFDDLLRMLAVPGEGSGASSQLPDADAAG